MKRLAVLLSLLALVLPLSVTPVLAAAPANDAYEGRILIEELPFTHALDTTEATTDATDADIRQGCGPAAAATVWFELRLSTDELVVVELLADYSTGIVVATGEPGMFEPVACGPGGAVFEAVAGVAYTMMVFDDQLDGGGIGGMLTINAAEAPPPPELTLSLDDEGSLNPLTDVATIHLQVSCDQEILADVFASVSQRIGQHTVLGGDGSQVECSPDPTAVALEIVGFTSTFNPGSVSVDAEAIACTVQCGFAAASGDVRLRSAPAQPPEPPEPPEPPAPPANDEPDGAFAIGLDETLTQDTSGATASEADPFDCPHEPVPPMGHTVWYAFTAPDDGFHVASTQGSDYDTVAFVLGPDGSVIGCDDDVILGTGGPSEAIFDAAAGETYLVVVGSFDFSGGGMLSLTVSTSEVGPPPPPPPGGDPPANDERTDAEPIGLGDVIGPLDTSGATAAGDDPIPSCTAPFGATVWYSLSVDADGWVALDTAGSDYDTALLVIADGEEVACNDDFQSLQARVAFFAVAGTEYEIMVGSFGSGIGGDLVLAAAPSGPPLSVEVSDLRATLDSRSGIVTLSGTVTCSVGAVAELFAGAEQQNGRFGVIGEGGTFVESCTPDGSAFSFQIIGNEAYRPGDAFVFGSAFASTEDEFADATFEMEVRLQAVRPGR